MSATVRPTPYQEYPHRPDSDIAIEVVAALSPQDRIRRRRVLIYEAHRIVEQTLTVHGDGREITAACLLWSSGRDSNTLAHLMHEHVTHAVHANTGIGSAAPSELDEIRA